ncbi:VWA domain-containing protein [Acidobacteria bacterium AH-259-D05]|nr:VWA domain-containing protein [Acidobacteria bacterium AH-259-D05]
MNPNLTAQPLSQSQRQSSVTQSESQRRPAQFRAEVDQVVLYSTVYDQDNNLVSGLQKEDFTIYEDKVQQEITYFGQDDVPSTIGIVIDSSGSMRDKFDMVTEATHLFLSMNNPENEMFFISFKDEVRLEEEFTQDVEDIYDALDNVIVSGGTALYDAIYLALDKAREGNELKKSVIVFTDGEDKDSYYSHEELMAKIEESDVQLYIVSFLDRELSNRGGFFGIFRSERQKIQEKIKALPKNSGGDAFFPEEIGQLNEIFRSIAYELRHQYRLAYISSNPVKDGSWRRTDVVVKEAKKKGLKVRSKTGYYAKKRTG